jgi:hypothetical protein
MKLNWKISPGTAVLKQVQTEVVTQYESKWERQVHNNICQLARDSGTADLEPGISTDSGVAPMYIKLLALCVIPLAVSQITLAQIVPNNSYAQTIVNTSAMLNNSLSTIIANQARLSPTPSNWCSPLPPPDLQRGADGHVPPELQRDPRYQAWLSCQNGQNTPQPGGSFAGVRPSNPSPAPTGVPGLDYPTPITAFHLPMTSTDFKPARPGHPFLEQYLQSQPFTNEQRAAMRSAFDQMSSLIAKAARPNNLAAAMTTAVCMAIYVMDNTFTDADSDRYLVAINDRLGASREVATMSTLQKQNASETLILQATMLKLLVDLGATDPVARVQGVQLAQATLLQLTGSPTGRLAF